MSVVDQLVQQIEALSADEREVLFDRLNSALPRGIARKSLLPVAGTLDLGSASEMIAAIESECERVDARECPSLS